MDSLSNLYERENDVESNLCTNPIYTNYNERKVSQIAESIHNSLLTNKYKKAESCDRIFKTILITLTFGILIFLGVITYFIVTHKL